MEDARSAWPARQPSDRRILNSIEFTFIPSPGWSLGVGFIAGLARCRNGARRQRPSVAGDRSRRPRSGRARTICRKAPAARGYRSRCGRAQGVVAHAPHHVDSPSSLCLILRSNRSAIRKSGILSACRVRNPCRRSAFAEFQHSRSETQAGPRSDSRRQTSSAGEPGFGTG